MVVVLVECDASVLAVRLALFADHQAAPVDAIEIGWASLATSAAVSVVFFKVDTVSAAGGEFGGASAGVFGASAFFAAHLVGAFVAAIAAVLVAVLEVNASLDTTGGSCGTGWIGVGAFALRADRPDRARVVANTAVLGVVVGIDACTVAKGGVGFADTLKGAKGFIGCAARVALAVLGATTRVVASTAVLVVPRLGVDAGIGAAQDALTIASFVDLSVAVVIAAAAVIAQFRENGIFAGGLPLPVGAAGLYTTFAVADTNGAWITGITGACLSCVACAGTMIVDLSVAIVVETVADLGGWKQLIVATAPPILTFSVGFAKLDTDLAGSTGARCGGIVGCACPAVTVTARSGYVTLARMGHLGIFGGAFNIVDFAVAVVVLAITDLAGGVHRIATGRPAAIL